MLMSRSAGVAGAVNSIRMRSMIMVVAGVAAAAVTVFTLLANSNAEFAQRRGASDIGRFAGLKVAAIAITDSPILGYGSWGHGTEKYADLYFADTLGDMMKIGAENMMGSGTGFLPHSQILQAWMEGGILAALFFLAYGWYTVVTIRDLAFAKVQTRFRGFLLALLLLNLWHLVMSPFMGGHRLDIASTVAILVCTALAGRREAHDEAHLRHAAVAAPANLLR
jgi:O-antigen ligase